MVEGRTASERARSGGLLLPPGAQNVFLSAKSAQRRGSKSQMRVHLGPKRYHLAFPCFRHIMQA